MQFLSSLDWEIKRYLALVINITKYIINNGTNINNIRDLMKKKVVDVVSIIRTINNYDLVKAVYYTYIT